MSPFLLLKFSFLLLMVGATQLPAQTLSEERSTDWTDVGCPEFSNGWTELNILDFGGSNDGITSNDDAFLDALAYLNGSPGVLFFPAGEYLFRQPLRMPNQLVIRGVAADQSHLVFDLEESDYAIQVVGERTEEETSITSPITRGDSRVEVQNPDLFQQGDYVMVYDLDTARVTSSWATFTTGQVHQVIAVTGSTVRLRNPFRRSYILNENPRIVRLDVRQQVGIEYLGIVRKDEPSEKNSNIIFQYAANCRVQCITSDYCDFSHLEAAQSTNIEIRGSFFQRAFDYGGGGKGYGVVLHYGTGQCLVENNIFSQLRHGMLLQAGANGNVLGYNYSTDPFWDQPGFPDDSAGDLVLHGNYPYANLLEGNIVQNIVIDDSHGAQGPYNTVFRNRAEGYGLLMGINPAPQSQNIIGNEITGELGLFFTAGEDHLLLANNNQGAIIPSGTATIPEASLYLDTIPAYFQIPDAWPAIGPGTDLGTIVNEAYARYQAGAWVACTDLPYGPPIESQTTQVTTTLPETNLMLYPNPAQERLLVHFDSTLDLDQWALLDPTGKMLQSGLQMPNEFDLSAFPSGLFFLHLIFSNGQISSHKFVVDR
jgi:hypothetical protein